MSREEFFDQLFNEATPAADELKRLRQLAYEERVIKRIFTYCGIRLPSWGRLANLCRAATGEKKLNFEWFNTEYGSAFPGRLSGKRIPYVHNITLTELFKPVKKHKLLRRLSPALDAAGINALADAYLFVFPLVRTPFCVHTLSTVADAAPGQPDQRLQLVFNLPNAKRTIFVEPLEAVSKTIGPEWFPI